MKERFPIEVEEGRVLDGHWASNPGDTFGAFCLLIPTRFGAVKGKLKVKVIVGDGKGWDHVSVSLPGRNRCPTWEEMCKIKELFFKPDEWVMQLHPPQDDNISFHDYCLHLWRPQSERGASPIPTPPRICV